MHFVEYSLLSLDSLVILQQLAAEVVCILLTLVLNGLLHLLEDGLVLFIESRLINGEVLVIQVKTLVLFLNFLGQRLAKSLNFAVKLQHSLSICLLLTFSLIILHVRALEGLGRLLKPRQEVILTRCLNTLLKLSSLFVLLHHLSCFLCEAFLAV